MEEVDLEKFISALKNDPPFSYPHPDERTKALLVETASIKLLKKELSITIRNFMHNSGITAIVGRARSGKTHFIRNLEFRVNEKCEYKGVVVVLPLGGEDVSMDYILNKIISNPAFERKVKELGINKNAYKDGFELINHTIQTLQSKYGVETGILLAVDNFDEHLRQREGKVTNLKKDIEQLLGIFRMLIEWIPKGLCVIFSLTEDAAEKLDKEFLSDPTLRGRFEFIYNPYEPGKRLVLSELTESEAMLMVSMYMEYWARRNDLKLPVLKECLVEGGNIFPFKPEAIKLFRDAGGFAGYICLGCRGALSRKYDAKSLEELLITEVDAALTISAKVATWPHWDAVRSRISNLVIGPRFVEDMKKWVESYAKIKYSGDLNRADLKTAFSNYLVTISEESEEPISVEPDITVIDPYTNNQYQLDLKITFARKTIGVVFTSDPIVKKTVGKPLSVALKNRNITHGIFIYIGEEPEPSVISRRKYGLEVDLKDELRDFVSEIDYNTVVTVMPINPLLGWAIVRANEATDPDFKSRIVGWVESELQILEKIRRLISAEPRKRPERFPPAKPGDFLGRSGA